MKKVVISIIAALAMLFSAAALAPSAASADIDWSFVRPVPPGQRVIEVVDHIPDPRWHVAAAERWLDRYTASTMRMVAKCSGKAYFCVTVRAGKVAGRDVGRTHNNTITIDTGKAMSGKYRKYYKYDSKRTWLLAHELGHRFGMSHSKGRNVMNPKVNKAKMTLTAGQRKWLRQR